MPNPFENLGENKPKETEGQSKFNETEGSERRLAKEREADAKRRLAERQKIKQEDDLQHKSAREAAKSFIADPSGVKHAERMARLKDLNDRAQK